VSEQNGGSAPQNEKRFGLQKIYVKDISFETPNSPQVFRQEWKPDVSVQLGNIAKDLGDNFHEITISITVTAKLQDKTAYLAEVHQAGIFMIHGFAKEELGPMVGSYCPNILFPYARETISSLVERGGFPQLLLEPINFEAIYQQHVQQMQQKEAEGQVAGSPPVQ